MGPELMLIGGAVQAIGAIQAGQAQKAEANARAQANQYNAKVKEMNAQIARTQANAREEQQRRKGRQVLGAQRAGIAQAGIGFGGSALDIMEQSADMVELDALNIRYEGELQSTGLLADAEAELYEADVNRMAGRNAMKAAYINAGSALIGGASNYSTYKAMSA